MDFSGSAVKDPAASGVSRSDTEYFMPRVPETRASLILRLPSTDDAVAWQEFASIYEPFVYRFARRGGLQDADARELVQNVMVSVARAVGRWKPDRARGRFRTWLFRIARNQLLDVLARRRGTAAEDFQSGSSAATGSLLDQLAARDHAAESLLQLEHRRELFHWAAERVRGTVRDATWQAFWMTSIEERTPEAVASILGLTTGAVYIARSRVLCRLQAEVRKWEDRNEML
jgi:RNA polymerase sigma factor (sigma-70 family)